MTVMTTSFMPCGAKLPIISMIATALFHGDWWVAPSTYFMGIAAIIISGLMLKKTKMFAGDPAPFVMELPEYRLPTISYILRSMWERVGSFVKRAGTIIFISSIFIWATSHFAVVGGFRFDQEMELSDSILGNIGSLFAWLFVPLGFGNITATVATIMGLVAKEEVVAVFGILDFVGMAPLAGYAFLAFNLLCIPCFAAVGSIRREMNNARWTAFTLLYQMVFAYAVSLMIYQFGLAFTGQVQILGLIAALIALALILYFLFRPNKYKGQLTARRAVEVR